MEFKPDRVGIMGAVARAVVTKLDVMLILSLDLLSAAVAASRGLNVLVLVVGRMANRATPEADNQNMRFGSGVLYEVRDAQLS